MAYASGELPVRCLATMVRELNLRVMNTEPRVRAARTDEAGLLLDLLVRA